MQVSPACTRRSPSLISHCPLTFTPWAVGSFSTSPFLLCFAFLYFINCKVSSDSDIPNYFNQELMWLKMSVLNSLDHDMIIIASPCCAGISSGWDGFPISSAYENFVDGFHCSIGAWEWEWEWEWECFFKYSHTYLYHCYCIVICCAIAVTWCDAMRCDVTRCDDSCCAQGRIPTLLIALTKLRTPLAALWSGSLVDMQSPQC